MKAYYAVDMNKKFLLDLEEEKLLQKKEDIKQYRIIKVLKHDTLDYDAIENGILTHKASRIIRCIKSNNIGLKILSDDEYNELNKQFG